MSSTSEEALDNAQELQTEIEADIQNPERKFCPIPPLWLFTIRPGPKKLEFLADVLLSLFFRKDGQIVLPQHTIPSPILNPKKLPKFTKPLTLVIPVEKQTGGVEGPEKQELAPSEKEEQAHLYDLLRQLFLRSRLSCDGLIMPPRGQSWDDLAQRDQEDLEEWGWHWPEDGKIQLYQMGERGCRVTWSDMNFWDRDENHIVYESLNAKRLRKEGHGVVCLVQAPIKDSVLEFRWVELILAQTGLWKYQNESFYPPTAARPLNETGHYYTDYLGSVLYFLGTFAGYVASRNDRSHFSSNLALIEDANEAYHSYLLQIHFSSFAVVNKLSDKIRKTDGLLCHRQHGGIESSAQGKAVYFEERRISIMGILSGQFHSGGSTPVMFRILILAEADTLPEHNLFEEEESGGLKWRKGLESTIAFHTAISVVVEIWETEWNNVLDQIDRSQGFQLDQTLLAKDIEHWMFDHDFKRSRSYFSILQILRIFGDHIRTVSEDLRAMDSIFLGETDSIDRNSTFPQPDLTKDEWLVLSSNWETVTKQQNDAESRLLKRISNKTEDVKSLRDGVFNATSLLEAHRSTTMNRYVIIFTVVTVLYLPPSFVSTVFGMSIFQKDIDQTIWEYKVTTVSVSLLTYVVALVSILAVNFVNGKNVQVVQEWLHKWCGLLVSFLIDLWRSIKHKLLTFWQSVRHKSTVEGNPNPTEGMPAGAATPSQAKPESQPPTNDADQHFGAEHIKGAKDEENSIAIDEGVGGAVKTRSLWPNWAHHASSSQLEKGKTSE